ncbi:transporter substrate-binding domain-containing protein [Spirulina major CS-329]|uniref:transporter substrate-binding domain-containing protein n=1 Tax=Spirulina TaxID=1154 RepID=UPI00232AB859|nr:MULTISPECIES: transporter substrate-binding domain-containing protein [Spirulina]MDB9493210.1 transporter substrate-binding domain-containing protein [Spirulina subsalsa CS-330]MDB9503547.1 transporter substrate-binding domain-containing protein [Spirulina major CS-329]
MIQRRRFLITLTCCASLILGLGAGCSSTPSETDSASEDSAADRTLVMATSADYPPYEFYETARGEGEPIGFDIDIANAIAEKLGYEIEISDMDFNGIIPALQSGRADFAMAGMTPTEERKENVSFSEIYYDAKNTIVSAKGAGFKTYDDLEGKTVGTQLGSIQEEEAKSKVEEGAKFTIESRNKISELIQEIKAGRIDAAIIENTVAKGYINANEDLEFTEIESDGESGSAIAFPKDSPLVEEFDAALTELKDSGELDKLIKKWFEDYYNEQAAEE